MNIIRESREELRMTLAELAEKIGVHFTTVSEWELGKISPRPDKKTALSEVLGKSIDQLFPNKELPRATHEGTLKIGERDIFCAVLNNGKRVISEKAVFDAFGRTPRGKREGGDFLNPEDLNSKVVLPAFIDARNLRGFINEDIIKDIRGLEYISKTGQIWVGYEAIVIPVVCDVYLSARKADVLTPNQKPLAEMSEMIVRSLSKVGIVALIDEATGYQQERDRNELNKLLEKYLSAEKLAWAKRFPDEFFKQLYRLRNWHYPNGNKHTPYVGKLINQIVYEKLPKGVLESLRERNPTNAETKRRKFKHHQYLSEDIGQPDLRDHLLQVVALMRGSPNWSSFERTFNFAFPDHSGIQIELDLDED